MLKFVVVVCLFDVLFIFPFGNYYFISDRDLSVELYTDIGHRTKVFSPLQLNLRGVINI